MKPAADAQQKIEGARQRAESEPSPADIEAAWEEESIDLESKKRADEEVWLKVIEAQRRAPEPTLEETLAAIRAEIANDEV